MSISCAPGDSPAPVRPPSPCPKPSSRKSTTTSTYFGSRIVLRPQEISNNPAIIRQLGVIAINTALEVDIYGHVNSSHVCGTQMMNGIGGAGDFERNARLSVFVCPSIAKGGRISTIVPFCSHSDHSEHSVHIVVTEQGMADLRGLIPARTRTSADRPLCPPGLSRLPPSLCRGGACRPHPPRPGTLFRAASQSDRARSHAPRA